MGRKHQLDARDGKNCFYTLECIYCLKMISCQEKGLTTRKLICLKKPVCILCVYDVYDAYRYSWFTVSTFITLGHQYKKPTPHESFPTYRTNPIVFGQRISPTTIRNFQTFNSIIYNVLK